MTRIYKLIENVKPLLDSICGINVKELLENQIGYEEIKSLEEIEKDVDVAVVLKSNIVVMDIADVVEYAEELDESAVTDFGYIVVKGNLKFSQNIDFGDVYDVTDISQISQLSDRLRLQIIKDHIENGVKFEGLDLVYVDKSVQIEAGAIIEHNVELKGDTKISKGARIGAGSILVNAVVKSEADIKASRIVDSEIGEKTTVGPFANIHTGTKVAAECRIGDFVEIKNSSLGFNTKSAHLAYIGDTDIGYKCNIGCGVIFVNYDGENKHRSVVGDGVFVGSNSNVVAPVKLEDGAYIAAGTTVTTDLPKNCMCIGRSRETIKENRTKYHKLDK